MSFQVPPPAVGSRLQQLGGPDLAGPPGQPLGLRLPQPVDDDQADAADQGQDTGTNVQVSFSGKKRK